MIDTQLSDYWIYFVSDYGRNSVHIAPKFFDLAPNDWLRLTSVYYSRFGMAQPPKDDIYIGKLPSGVEAIRSHRVDAIVLENPAMDDMATFLHDTWVAKRAALEKSRTKEPDPIILPPKEEPPLPEPEPEPVEPKKDEPEKPKKAFPWKRVLGIVFGVAATASAFLPPPYNFLAAKLFALLQALSGG